MDNGGSKRKDCAGCKPVVLVSACLLGLPCRYDGQVKRNEGVVRLEGKVAFIPVCPEQLGGLPTPRPACEIVGERVLTEEGADYTEAFVSGAESCVAIARLTGAKIAVLKSKSPSCGSGQIKDGTFTGTLKPGRGVTASALQRADVRVVNEKDIATENHEIDFC